MNWVVGVLNNIEFEFVNVCCSYSYLNVGPPYSFLNDDALRIIDWWPLWWPFYVIIICRLLDMSPLRSFIAGLSPCLVLGTDE